MSDPFEGDEGAEDALSGTWGRTAPTYEHVNRGENRRDDVGQPGPSAT